MSLKQRLIIREVDEVKIIKLALSRLIRNKGKLTMKQEMDVISVWQKANAHLTKYNLH